LGRYAAKHVRTNICDIDNLQKRLMQTWFDFEQNAINAAIDQWRDRLRSCVRADGGLLEHAVKLLLICIMCLCGSAEHFMKLSM